MHVYMGVGILFQSRTEIIILEGILNFMLKLTYGRTGKGGENIGHKSFLITFEEEEEEGQKITFRQFVWDSH